MGLQKMDFVIHNSKSCGDKGQPNQHLWDFNGFGLLS